MPGAGLEPARPLRGTPDFKSPLPISAYLGGSEFFLLTGPIRPSDRLRPLGLSRRVSLPLLLPPREPLCSICGRAPGSPCCRVRASSPASGSGRSRGPLAWSEHGGCDRRSSASHGSACGPCEASGRSPSAPRTGQRGAAVGAGWRRRRRWRRRRWRGRWRWWWRRRRRWRRRWRRRRRWRTAQA